MTSRLLATTTKKATTCTGGYSNYEKSCPENTYRGRVEEVVEGERERCGGQLVTCDMAFFIDFINLQTVIARLCILVGITGNKLV